MPFIPVELTLQIFKVHLLSEGKAVFLGLIIFAPGKMVHEPTKSRPIKIFSRANACNFFKGVTVLLVRKAQLFLDDMNDG